MIVDTYNAQSTLTLGNNWIFEIALTNYCWNPFEKQITVKDNVIPMIIAKKNESINFLVIPLLKIR